MAGYRTSDNPKAFPVISFNRLDAAGLNEVYLAIFKALRKVEDRVYNASIHFDSYDHQAPDQLIVRMHDDGETISLVVCKLYDDPLVRAEEIVHQSVEPVIFFLMLGRVYGTFLERRNTAQERRP